MTCDVRKLKYRKIHGERNKGACVDIEKKTTDGFENGLGYIDEILGTGLLSSTLRAEATFWRYELACEK